MKIQYNPTILACVTIVFVVSTAIAKNVLQNPVTNNQLKTEKFSVKQSSNIHLPIFHIDAVVKPLTDATTNTTMVSSSANITTKKSTFNGTTYTTSIEETTIAQTTEITSVETVTEYQTSTNQTTESEFLITRNIIIAKLFTKCPSGQTENSNGGCSPAF